MRSPPDDFWQMIGFGLMMMLIMIGFGHCQSAIMNSVSHTVPGDQP